MENIKQVFMILITGIIAFLEPITGDIFSLTAIFFLNFIFGLLAALIANSERWNMKKAMRCFAEATVFFVLIGAIFFIGKQKDDMSGALQCVSFVSYTAIYFYAVNILRNIRLLLPKNRAIAFLYEVLSIEFAKKIPFLHNYLSKEKEE